MGKYPWYIKVIENPKLNEGIMISDNTGSLWVTLKINRYWILLQKIKIFFIIIKENYGKGNGNRS